MNNIYAGKAAQKPVEQVGMSDGFLKVVLVFGAMIFIGFTAFLFVQHKDVATLVPQVQPVSTPAQPAQTAVVATVETPVVVPTTDSDHVTLVMGAKASVDQNQVFQHPTVASNSLEVIASREETARRAKATAEAALLKQAEQTKSN